MRPPHTLRVLRSLFGRHECHRDPTHATQACALHNTIAHVQVDKALDSLSMDEGEGESSMYTRDPRDPNKFFQQQDTQFSDGLQWALFLAIMWALVQAWSSLDGF
jgi:hypothetical protein